MRQETIEEVAERLFTEEKYPTSFEILRKAFISNAKYQSERMYTYDELRQIAYNAYCKGQLDEPTEGKYNLWIQQFKSE